MARSIISIKADLYYIGKAIEQTSCLSKDFDFLIRKRNELYIELEHAHNPVCSQKKEIEWIYLPSKIDIK